MLKKLFKIFKKTSAKNTAGSSDYTRPELIETFHCCPKEAVCAYADNDGRLHRSIEDRDKANRWRIISKAKDEFRSNLAVFNTHTYYGIDPKQEDLDQLINSATKLRKLLD